MPPSTHRFGLAQLETARCLREHPEAEAALAATAAAGGYDAGVYAPSWAPKLEGDAGCLAGLPSWVQRDGLVSRGEGAKYLRSVYFAITVLSTVGYGDIRPRSESEGLFMVSSHHLAGSRRTSHHLASPRRITPHLASPRLASPRLASPRALLLLRLRYSVYILV